MGRFAERYSDEQRAAVVRAQVDDGMSARAAVEAAKSGQLYGLEPFEFSKGTAADYAGKERRRRRGDEQKAKEQGTPEERAEAMVERSLSILEAQLERVERRAKHELKPDDIERIRKLTSAAREVRALARGLPTTKGGSVARREREAGRSSAQNPPDDGGGLVERMLAEHKAEQNGEPHTSPAPSEGGDQDSATSGQRAAAEQGSREQGQQQGTGAHGHERKPNKH